MLAVFLLALLAQGGLAQAEELSLEALRWEIRPSLVEVAQRIDGYAVQGDFRRARLAADLLGDYRRRLDGHDGLVYRDLLETALDAEDAVKTRLAVRSLVRADLDFLFVHLDDEAERSGPSPRTRLLMVKQDVELLALALPADERGLRIKALLQQMCRELADGAPGGASYVARGGWAERALERSRLLRGVLDEAFPELARPVAGAAPQEAG